MNLPGRWTCRGAEGKAKAPRSKRPRGLAWPSSLGSVARPVCPAPAVRPISCRSPGRSIGDDQPSGPFGHLRHRPQLTRLPRRDGPPFSGRPGDSSDSRSSCLDLRIVWRRRWRSSSPARRSLARASAHKFHATSCAQCSPQPRVHRCAATHTPVDEICARNLFTFGHSGDRRAGAAGRWPSRGGSRGAGTDDASGDDDARRTGQRPGVWPSREPGANQERTGSRHAPVGRSGRSLSETAHSPFAPRARGTEATSSRPDDEALVRTTRPWDRATRGRRKPISGVRVVRPEPGAPGRAPPRRIRRRDGG